MKDGERNLRLDRDQQQRIGFVLGIHAMLRSVFSNQANVQSFPRLKNGNEFFEERSPLDVMAQGDMISLYETCKRLEKLGQLMISSPMAVDPLLAGSEEIS